MRRLFVRGAGGWRPSTRLQLRLQQALGSLLARDMPHPSGGRPPIWRCHGDADDIRAFVHLERYALVGVLAAVLERD